MSSDPTERLCLWCGANIAHKRANAQFCGDSHSKAYRRSIQRQEAKTPAATLPTAWAAEERSERDQFRSLVLRQREKKFFRPRLVDAVEDEVDRDVLDVWIEESEGRKWRHGRRFLAKAVPA